MDFSTIYQRYSGCAYSVAFKFGLRDEEAEDAVQEIFLKVHQNYEKLRDPGSFTVWFKTLATNHVKTLLGRKIRERNRTAARNEDDDPIANLPQQQEESEPESIIFISRGQETDVAWEHLTELVRTMVDLPANPHTRAVAKLRFIDGKSTKEIAEELAMPMSTVSSHVRKFKIVAERTLKRLYGEPL